MLCWHGSSAAICDNTALKMADANRRIFLDFLNEVRGKIAAGTAPNHKDTKLPTAKNMYKLLYDCDMELELQTDLDKCTGEATFTDYAQNMMKYLYANVSLLTTAKYLPTAMQSWYDPVIYYGLNAENTYNDGRLFTFANMIYANATKVACYTVDCKDAAGFATNILISCIFNAVGTHKNNTLYQSGNKCASDSECTTYKGSTCDVNTGLCEFTGDPTVSSMCTGNKGMTDEGRMKVLNAHNYRRGLLARGLITNGKNPNKRLPQAYYMPVMTYDCTVEAEAIEYAKTCALTKSEENSRQDYGENIFVHNIPLADPVAAFDAAVKSWWRQIFADGINQQVKFTKSLRDKRVDQKGFTQMAWANSKKLGCAMQTCSSSSFIVCRYSPKGNILGQNIYRIGRTCAGCPATCNTTDGLCY